MPNRPFLLRAFCVAAAGALLAGLSAASRAAAEPETSAVGFLPEAKDLFSPLTADPRELQYAVRWMTPVSYKSVGQADMGGYLGLYRWALPGADHYAQVSLGGGAFALFDLADTKNDMQAVDFYANLPLDVRLGERWSTRLLFYHTSSHLGDDYLKSTGQTTEKHSWDNVKWLWSYQPVPAWRLYGGYNYIFRTLPEGLGRNALQGGLEWRSAWWCGGHAQTYWANDVQSWERSAWNPAYTGQLGVRLARRPGPDQRALSVFLEFGSGPRSFGQFYLDKQTYWAMGLRFDLA